MHCTSAVDNSPLIVESFDETVFPDKDEDQEEIEDYENSLEAIKANMDRILAQVGVGKKSENENSPSPEEPTAPASSEYKDISPLPVEVVVPNENVSNIMSNVMSDFTPEMVPGMPQVLNTEIAGAPAAATSITGELIADMSQFEPEVVPGQIENAEQREKSKAKGRRTGRIDYNQGGETQDFFPLPRTTPVPDIYVPPTTYGIPLPTTVKLLSTITFGSLVSVQHAAEQKPVDLNGQPVKKNRGRPRTLPCPPMEALQQELAQGNVEFSVSGGSITMLASNNPNEKPKRKRKSCIHGRDKGKCRECGGISFCIHQRYKYTCIDCGGPGAYIYINRLVNVQVFSTFRYFNSFST